MAGDNFLRTCFDDMDLNKDGYITEDDMRAGVERNIFDPVLALMFVGHFDKNGDRKVSYEEYRERILMIPFQAME
ncbi:unnamed protein product [Protopolystoma xenopodis]|uniref:EF-hand domain-containing protein n=1 Tax=Protopolystoma xenopodis TaxID=117903 RepID=A0A3S5FFJ7_9PLAT|nr:unnamed protein product [Protopolystoma xenopodis]